MEAMHWVFRRLFRRPRQQCSICCRNVSTSQIAKLSHNHGAATVCTKCLLRHAETAIKANETRVSCLQTVSGKGLCPEEVSAEDLRSLGLRSAVLDTLLDNQFSNWMEKHPNFLSCAHRNCNNGVLFEGLEAGRTIMVCSGTFLSRKETSH